MFKIGINDNKYCHNILDISLFCCLFFFIPKQLHNLGWLFAIYTIDWVLDVYINKAEGGVLDGKTYEELKSEWHAYLIAKGDGIEIPGSL